jgi:nucleoside-diphosphate-sugar epimerase
MTKQKVLLTGAAGFIGSHTVRDLAEAGHEIVGLDIKEPDEKASWIMEPARDAVTLELGNVDQWGPLADAIMRHQPTAIVHAASLVRPDILKREPFTALRINLVSSINVFEAARVFGIKRVVYISSIGVLPPNQYTPIDANHPIFTSDLATPDTFYGAAKISSEAFAFAYHQAVGLDVLIIRPSAVYGFGMQWPIHIRPLVENSVAGLPTRFESGAEMLRDYTHAADIAQLIRRCVEVDPATVKDRIFYGGTGRDPVTVAQLAAIVRKLIPDASIEVGPGIPEEYEMDARTRGRFDMRAAIEQLGFAPRFTDVQDGIADYIEQLKRYEQQKKEGGQS